VNTIIVVVVVIIIVIIQYHNIFYIIALITVAGHTVTASMQTCKGPSLVVIYLPYFNQHCPSELNPNATLSNS